MPIVVGLFDQFTPAQQVVDELVKRGFRRDEISFMANATSSQLARYFGPGVTAEAAPMNGQERPLTAGEGAGVGATVGAITGIVVGLASFVIPGVGPLIGSGPLIAGLTGGAVGVIAGAATGGLAASLVEAGVPQGEADIYEESIRRGGTLIAVQSPETAVDNVRKVMRDHYAVDITQRRAELLAEDGKQAGGAIQVSPTGRATFESFDSDFRKHYAELYTASGYTYDQLVPFYRYGYDLAIDPRYASATWDEVEAETQPKWQELNPKGNWENFRDAVRFGWDSVRHTR